MPSDYWDLFFKPGTSASNPHRFFSSRQDALTVEVNDSTLKQIDQYRDATPGAMPPYNAQYINCNLISNSDPNIARRGKMSCITKENQLASYAEEHISGEDAMKGYSSDTFQTYNPPGTYEYSVNVMSYNFGFGPPLSISDSQTLMIRNFLRYEVPIVNPLFAGLNLSSGRTRLGRNGSKAPRFNLDFNHDGRRDIAVWTPPTTATGVGSYTIWLSSWSGSTLSFTPYTRSGGMLGDIPVPADYNGDGRTDMAFYRPSSTGLGTDPATWFWCPSSSSAIPSCSSWSSLQWGNNSDVPIPGLEFDNSAGDELTVFRPSDGTFYWTNRFNSWSSRNIGPLPTTPMAEDYDGDGLTDVAGYVPNLNYIRVFFSSCGWSTTCAKTVTFPSSFLTNPNSSTPSARAAPIPIGNMRTASSQFTPLQSLVLWHPGTGMWAINEDPLHNSSVYTCQWGDPTDIPLGGLGPSSGSIKHDLSVFRSGESSGAGHLLREALFSNGTCGPNYSDANFGTSPTRWPVYAVGDMTGDPYAEVIQFDPDNMYLYIFTSTSNYQSWSGLALNRQGVLL